MSYLRLFIELRREDTGANCGQARVELQDRPGRVDCKVRCGLMGLPVGRTYEMALACEQGGRYKEYPLGQFVTNPRGQAGPMFRGSFPIEPAEIPVTNFKAVVARCSDETSYQRGGRIVGYRFEPMLIPDRYEEPLSLDEPVEEPMEPEAEEAIEPVVEPEPEVAVEPETIMEPEPAVEPERWPESEPVPEPEMWSEPEPGLEPEMWPEPEPAAEPEMWPEPEPGLEPEMWPEPESGLEPEMWPEPEAVPEPEALPEFPMPEVPVIQQRSLKEEQPPQFAPVAVYVLRDLSQVDLVCGNAGRRAFQRYRHLILAQQDKENYLGIPCRFRPSQRIELAEEGYTQFYAPHGEEPGFGEFGYWMKRL